MSSLDPDTRKLIYEAAAALVALFVVAWLLFRVFFSDWRDYLLCCYPSSRSLSSFAAGGPDANDRFRGYVYHCLCFLAGGLAFYFARKFLG